MPLMPAALVGTGTQAAAATITSFTLVDAFTNRDLFELTPGIVLDLAGLPATLNIRANTDGTPVDSVVFALTGAQVRNHVERIAPYALFSDLNGDYFPWSPPLGSYSLRATPYTGGVDGGPLTRSFSVINSVGFVTSLVLVNADTDLDIMAVTPGMTLDLRALPTTRLNIRANISPTTVGSVTFDLTGPQPLFNIENLVPYALVSDFQGNYPAWTPVSGSYSLTVTPFSAGGGGGVPGSVFTLAFSVVNSPALPVRLTAFAAEAQGTAAVLLRWATATEENNREFVVQRSFDGREFTAIGRVAGHGSTTMPQAYTFADKELPARRALLYYRLRQVDTDGTSTFSPVRTVTAKGEAGKIALQIMAPDQPGMALRYQFTGPLLGAEQVEMYSIMGQRLGKYRLAADGTGSIPVDGLPTGTYVLHLVSAGGHYASRFVLR
ncbi:hypothetical protein GCM10022407_09340 [Hymenobacter antarcticus]|uniref:Por secretion system C-terminal sorting domain-containing protein n=2 Tax=Hymenobacter antarcticus TaxID=486270 RepID=A0ABP7PFY9_9BACT